MAGSHQRNDTKYGQNQGELQSRALMGLAGGVPSTSASYEGCIDRGPTLALQRAAFVLAFWARTPTSRWGLWWVRQLLFTAAESTYL